MPLHLLIFSSFNFYKLYIKPTNELFVIFVQPKSNSFYSLFKLEIDVMEMSVRDCSSQMDRWVSDFSFGVRCSRPASVILEHRVKFNDYIADTVADNHYNPSSPMPTHPSI